LPENTATAILKTLDLTDSRDLLIAFHHFRHWPAIKPIDPEAAVPDYLLIERFLPEVFGVPDTPQSGEAVRNFLFGADAPREWLCVFREAFEQGLIGPIGFGAAVHYLIAVADCGARIRMGNATPGLIVGSEASRRAILADALRASPAGLMRPHERTKLAEQPDTLTVWRGGCYGPGDTAFQRAQSLHWVNDPDAALTWLRARFALALLDRRNALQAHLRDLQAGRPPALNLTSMLPSGSFLLRADVPKDLVIAYLSPVPDEILAEVWIDFEKLDPGMVRDVTPKEYRLAA
jgi:hypothetical protein